MRCQAYQRDIASWYIRRNRRKASTLLIHALSVLEQNVKQTTREPKKSCVTALGSIARRTAAYLCANTLWQKNVLPAPMPNGTIDRGEEKCCLTPSTTPGQASLKQSSRIITPPFANAPSLTYKSCAVTSGE